MTDTATLDLDKIRQLRDAGFQMISGHGDDGARGCAMDLVAYAATGEWTDLPPCVHRLLACHVQRLNDSTDDVEFRWRLALEVGPLLVGTNEWPDVAAVRAIGLAGRTVAGLCEAVTIAGANLTGANLAGARGDEWTRLPAGFQVVAGLVAAVPT